MPRYASSKTTTITLYDEGCSSIFAAKAYLTMKWIYSTYVLAALGVMLSFDVFWKYDSVHIISKGLLAPILIGAVLLSGKLTNSKKLLIAGLVFCGFGDMFMLKDYEELYFLFGLGAFLSAHVFYSMVFRKAVDPGHVIPILVRVRLWTFLFIILGAAVFFYLRPSLDKMEIPVLLYIGVIVFMSMQAFNRYGRTDSGNYWTVFVGACLFMISDTLIGVNKFKDSIPQADYWIMGSYMLSQWMIVRGIIAHENSKGIS